MRAGALLFLVAAVVCASARVLPQRQLLQTKYGDQYWCPDLPSEFGSCETGVALKDSMKSPSKDAAPTDGVQAYMKSATDNFQRIYSISCKPAEAPRLICQNSYDANSWLVIFDISCDVGRGTLGAWGTNEGGDGKISGTVSWYSYNNIICDAGIKKDGGEGSSGAGAGSGSGGSTPSPTPASNGEGSQGGEEGLDWEKLLDAKPSICDPLPAELTTCGTGTLGGYNTPVSDLGGFIDQAVTAYNRDYAPYTGLSCSNPGKARIACSGIPSSTKVAIFDADCGSAGRVTLGAWGTDENGDGQVDRWSYIDVMCKKI